MLAFLYTRDRNIKRRDAGNAARYRAKAVGAKSRPIIANQQIVEAPQELESNTTF